MESQEQGSNARLAASVVLLAVIGASVIAAVYLETNQSASSATSTSGSALISETAESSMGLELVLSVNSTTIPSQDAISMNASILNTLPAVNNLTASDNWAIQGLSSGPCDPGDATNMLFSPVGFGVFKGSYGLNNLSSAGEPLRVWAIVECAASFVFNGTKILGSLYNVTSYSMPPQGENSLGNDIGNYSGYYIVPPPPNPPCNAPVCTYTQPPEMFAKGVFPTRMDAQATINAANGTGFYNSLDSALPASYMLVAGDEWGQVVLLHFAVAASSSLPKVGSFLASSGACDENGNPVPCTTSEFSEAFIFNCATEAATSSGCTRQVSSGVGDAGSPLTSYTITVRYPYVNQTGEPAGANCMFSVRGDTVPPYGNCFMVNATAFAMSVP